MKKKIFALLLVLCMCVSVFAGCSLVEIDEKSYQSAIVATITYTDGEIDKIDKTELLLAYSSYGYNYNEDYKQAIRQTLDTVVQQHVTIKAVKNYYKELNKDSETEVEPLLNDNETSYLWEQTRDSIYEQIEEKYFEVVNYEEPEEQEDSSTTTDGGVVYKPYQPSVYMTKDKFSQDDKVVEKLQIRNNVTTDIVRNDNSNKKVFEGHVYDFESEEYDFKKLMFDNLYNAMGTNETESSVRAWRSAVRQYEDTIERNFSYLNYKDDEWLEFECQRVYDIMLNNYLVQKYTEIYNKNQNKDNNLSNIQVKDVVESYAKKVNEDYNTYRKDASAYSEAVLNNTGDVDYFLNDANQNYFYVGAIKVDISATQQKLLNDTNSGDPLVTQKVHDAVFNVNSVSAEERNLTTGGKSGNLITVAQLLSLLREDINKFQYKTKDTMTPDEQKDAYYDLKLEDRGDETAKAKAIETWLTKYNQKVDADRAEVFRNYMFKYSDDDSTKNATNDMVFGYDNTTKSVLLNSTVTSKITDEKKLEEAKEKILKICKPDAAENAEPVFGATTDLIEADDGYYIFFYAGEVSNLFEPVNGSVELTENDVYALRERKLSVFSNKTVFDKLYEDLLSNFSDNFSVYQNLDIDALMSKDKNDKRRIVENYVYYGDELYN